MGHRIRGVVRMSDFLLELRCEEIPARMQAGARADLEKLFRKELEVAGVSVGSILRSTTSKSAPTFARRFSSALIKPSLIKVQSIGQR